ncbi:hypothetical protein EYF80_050064 [Liparis tanakae]|uniref:Uncharacterized protein n=1 Tax=Liparis tanakae TaxID=230148 RepID=A0A4Z2FHH6_9TELE|nr:hypothetical protein EYF80_050064 [Liparis tanakae]
MHRRPQRALAAPGDSLPVERQGGGAFHATDQSPSQEGEREEVRLGHALGAEASAKGTNARETRRRGAETSVESERERIGGTREGELESDGCGETEAVRSGGTKRKEGWRQMENRATGVSALVKVLGLPPPLPPQHTGVALVSDTAGTFATAINNKYGQWQTITPLTRD